MSDPKFLKRLNRARKLLCREIRDGCPDCMETRGYCKPHLIEVREMTLHPTKNKQLMDMLGMAKEPEESA